MYLKTSDNLLKNLSDINSGLKMNNRKRLSRGIPDEAFSIYCEEMKRSPRLFDEYIISNRANASFRDLSSEETATVFNAALACARYLKMESQED